MTNRSDLQSSATGTASRWRSVDIVVAAIIGVAFGIVFWAWGLLWYATDPVFKALPPAQGFMYGVWLMPGVLGMLVIRKPGAAVFTELVAALVSVLVGVPWGVSVVLYGLLEGLAPELVFLAGRYRRFTLGIATFAGAAAGLMAATLDKVFYYPTWTSGWTMLYFALVTLSSLVLAGIGSWFLVRALATTGVLDQFASGRERKAV